MQQNFLIGIGGTGARAMEAAIHLAAAGLGPDRLTMFLVDPDMSNGNLVRTSNLIAGYKAARNALKAGAADPDMRLFHTEIVTPEPLVWGLGEHNHTLGRYLNYAGTKETPLGKLMSVLFSPEELGTELNEGFRGHPSIGAVLLASTNMAEEPWQTFWNSIHDCGEHEARVFMVGSIFGGTGAAGVPTFGAPDMLKFADAAAIVQRDRAAGEQGRSRIYLGAALVLPYFSVVANSTVSDGDLYVTSSDFPIATKAALQFYADKPELTFDEIFLVGDSLAHKVGAFSKGSKKQENRAHYVEAATALAALDFFSQPRPPAGAEPKVFSTARESQTVDWQSLPVARRPTDVPARQAETKLRLAVLAIFAYAVRTYGEMFRSSAHDRDLSARPWVRSFGKADGDPRTDPESVAALNAASAVAQRVLDWISELDDDNVQLFDRSKLWEGDATPTLVPAYRNGEPTQAIGALLKGGGGLGLRFGEFVDGLDQRARRTPLPGIRPADRFLQLFYGAAVDFYRHNYLGQPAKGN